MAKMAHEDATRTTTPKASTGEPVKKKSEGLVGVGAVDLPTVIDRMGSMVLAVKTVFDGYCSESGFAPRAGATQMLLDLGLRGGDALLASGPLAGGGGGGGVGYGNLMSWSSFVMLYASLCGLTAPSLDVPKRPGKNDDINTPYQHILATHPINPSYQPTLSTHPNNTTYQHLLTLSLTSTPPRHQNHRHHPSSG